MSSPKTNKTIIATKEEVRALMKSNFKSKSLIYAFYTSHLDRIIKDEDLMVIPFYDRQVHRAHSIFDTVDIIDGKFLLLDQHLARFNKSLSLVSIDLPMPLEVIREKILDVASFCMSQYNINTLSMRYWISSGGENFGIMPSGKPVFYLAAFHDSGFDVSKPLKEYSITNIDPKVGVLAEAKTTNYLINCLVTMEARKKGGYLGIMTSKEGYLLEASIMNVAFVYKNGDFVTPKFDKSLKGTTLIEVMDLINEVFIKNEVVRNLVQKDVTAKEVYENASEMMLIGGNFIVPIGMFDDRTISTEVGPVTKLLQQHYLPRVLAKAEKVPLNRYKKSYPSPKL